MSNLVYGLNEDIVLKDPGSFLEEEAALENKLIA
jgi:hypothetical protein